MKNIKGFVMLEVVLSAVIVIFLMVSSIKINTLLNAETKIVLRKTNGLLSSWSIAERNHALKNNLNKD